MEPAAQANEYAQKCPRCGRLVSGVRFCTVNEPGGGRDAYGRRTSYEVPAVAFRCCDEFDVPVRMCGRTAPRG